MTKQQEAGGKGLTRVEIARRAVAKAKAKLNEANDRLNRAIQDEAGRADKRKAQTARTQEHALKVLERAGMSLAEAKKALKLS